MLQKPHDRQRLRFYLPSFGLFLITLAMVAMIAILFRGGWIRHLVGDMLIVMVIAYLIHAWIALPLRTIPIGTLMFAWLIELLQFFKIIDILGWRGSQLAHLTIGSTFDWRDLIAYTIGAAIVILAGKDTQP